MSVWTFIFNPNWHIGSHGMCCLPFIFQAHEGAQEGARWSPRACFWSGLESYALRKLETVIGEAEVN